MDRLVTNLTDKQTDRQKQAGTSQEVKELEHKGRKVGRPTSLRVNFSVIRLGRRSSWSYDRDVIIQEEE